MQYPFLYFFSLPFLCLFPFGLTVIWRYRLTVIPADDVPRNMVVCDIYHLKSIFDLLVNVPNEAFKHMQTMPEVHSDEANYTLNYTKNITIGLKVG